MEKIEKILGDNIRTRRKELGLTQEALAESAGVSMFTVQAYESGRRWPELPTLDKISAVLGIPTARLFQLKEPITPSNEELLRYFAENLGYEITKKN